jgi:hypothetical protein
MLMRLLGRRCSVLLLSMSAEVLVDFMDYSTDECGSARPHYHLA